MKFELITWHSALHVSTPAPRRRRRREEERGERKERGRREERERKERGKRREFPSSHKRPVKVLSRSDRCTHPLRR